jgi:sugar (pentulose or hexulose) kinase
VCAVDVGTESLRAAIFDADGTQLASCAEPHATSYPAPGHAEQAPSDWWAGLGAAVRRALGESGRAAEDVAAVCLATTSCTVLALDEAGEPLRPSLLWMDARAAPQVYNGRVTVI